MVLPRIKGDLTDIAIASGYRGLFTSQCEATLKLAENMLQEVNLNQINDIAESRNWDFKAFLIEYFSSIGFKKEIIVLLEPDAKILISVLDNKKEYFKYDND